MQIGIASVTSFLNEAKENTFAFYLCPQDGHSDIAGYRLASIGGSGKARIFHGRYRRYIVGSIDTLRFESHAGEPAMFINGSLITISPASRSNERGVFNVAASVVYALRYGFLHVGGSTVTALESGVGVSAAA